jgi:ATP-binding cassette subfamily B protein
MAIARLLLKAPDVVVLDEATAHLDSESEAAVQRALRTALTGRTSLVIDEGRIVERGTHDALLAEGGLYAELYRTQFRQQASPTNTPDDDGEILVLPPWDSGVPSDGPD